MTNELPDTLRGVYASYGAIQPLTRHGAMGVSVTAQVLEGHTKDSTVFVKLANIPEEISGFIDLKEAVAQRHAGILSEFTNFQQLHDLTCIAQIFDAGLYVQAFPSGLIALLPFLVQEYVPGTDGFDHIKDLSKASGSVELAQFVSISRALLRAIEAVHGRFVIHGDIHPGNLIIPSGEESSALKVVDFGQAYLSNIHFNTLETATRRSSNFYYAPERKAKADWGYQADIYSCGMCLLHFATGIHLAPSEDSDESKLLKKIFLDEGLDSNDLTTKIEGLIAEKNKALLDDFPALSSVIAKATQNATSRRYSSMREFADNFDTLGPRARSIGSPSRSEVQQMIKKWRELNANLGDKPFFEHVANQSFRELKGVVEALSSPHPRIDRKGTREQVLGWLVDAMSMLDRADEYISVTTPRVWSRENLGFNGRFMGMNQALIKRGVVIRRIFLVPNGCETYGQDGRLFKNICRSHERLQTLSPEEDTGSVFRYSLAAQEHVDSLLQFGHVVALWVKNGEYISISFDYEPNSGQLSQVSFMGLSKSRGQALRKSMLARIESGLDLC